MTVRSAPAPKPTATDRLAQWGVVYRAVLGMLMEGGTDARRLADLRIAAAQVAAQLISGTRPDA